MLGGEKDRQNGDLVSQLLNFKKIGEKLPIHKTKYREYLKSAVSWGDCRIADILFKPVLTELPVFVTAY
jgi:hypothetical protein